MQTETALQNEIKKYRKNHYNDVALKLAQRLLGLEHLHYGYFDENTPVNFENLGKAQLAYVQALKNHVPCEVQSILDVGSGTGGVAKKLRSFGYDLNCIDPNPFMVQKTKENNEGIKAYHGFYENFSELPDRYDMILMSESCQYIDVDKGFRQHSKYLNENGYVMAADFFKIKPLDQPYLSKSGHDLKSFLNSSHKNGFNLVQKTDITKEVAPTMDLYQEMINEKIIPVLESGSEIFNRRFPLLHKTLGLFFKKKYDRLKLKYQNQDAKTFSKYKGYYILLFQKAN